MGKPRSQGPYSIEELSDMDDDELGELYRTKDRTKEHYDDFWINEAKDFLLSTTMPNSDAVSFVIAIQFGAIVSVPLLTHNVIIWIAAFLLPFILYLGSMILSAVCSGILILFALIKNLPRFVRNRNWKKKGFDAFDDLYPHDYYKSVFTYLFSKCHNKYGHLGRWLSMIHKATDEEVIHLYSNTEFGHLLKNILPALAYIDDTNKDLDEESFNVLDQEYGLTESMNRFIHSSYSNAMSVIQEAEHAVSSSGVAMDFVEMNRERNRERLNRKSILDHSPDYKRIKDLNSHLKHSKNELEDNLPTELLNETDGEE